MSTADISTTNISYHALEFKVKLSRVINIRDLICMHLIYLPFCLPLNLCYKLMLCTAQLGGPVSKASGRVHFSPFQLADKSPMITDQHTAGRSVSQLSLLAKLSPWLTLSTKDITTSFWHYNKWFWFLSNQIMGLYHLSSPIELNLCIYGEK